MLGVYLCNDVVDVATIVQLVDHVAKQISDLKPPTDDGGIERIFLIVDEDPGSGRVGFDQERQLHLFDTGGTGVFRNKPHQTVVLLRVLSVLMEALGLLHEGVRLCKIPLQFLDFGLQSVISKPDRIPGRLG